MEIEKDIAIRIDVPNPSSIVNINDFCVGFLEKTYKNKCFADCYVTEIKSIKQRSACIMHTTAPSNIGFVDAIVSIVGKRYTEGVVISCANIVNIDIEGNIYLTSGNLQLVVKASNVNIFGLVKGNKVNVKIVHGKHPIYSPSISCLAELYFYPRDEIYTIEGELTKEETELIDAKIASIKKLNTKDIPSAVYDYFYSLTYPFKDKPEDKGVSLFDYKNIKGTIKRGKNHPASGLVELSKEPAPITSKLTILMRFLFTYEQNLKSLINMCETFATEESRKNNLAVWNIYKTNKK